MTLSRQKIWTINITVSTVILFLTVFFSTDILSSLHGFLLSINRPLAFSSFSIIDAIILGLIPIWSYFLYSSKTYISSSIILLANLATLVSTIMICITAFILVAKFSKVDSPWIPDYVVQVPFPYLFWTAMFILGVTLPHLIKRIIR